MKRPAVIVLAAMLVLAGCAAVPKQKARNTLSEGIDENSEKRLLVRSEEERLKLDRSGFLYDDQGLEDYLNRIARKVWPPTQSGPHLSVKIIKNPELNAFAIPSGRIYVHTGILASMENEAQLAVLLSHELIHVVNRHSAQEFTKRKIRSESKATLNSWLGSFGEALGSFAIMVSVNGYSREFEAEADRLGLEQAVKAGYDPQEAPKLHQLFLEELDAKKSKASFAYSRHPATKDRIASYQELLRTDYKGKQGVLNADVYRRHTMPLLLDNAVLELKLGNWASAEKSVRKYMGRKRDDARAFFLLGEVCRELAGADGERDAVVNYQKAVALKQDYPEPYRAIGMIAYKKGDKEQARKNLERYLALKPGAEDGEYILKYINESR
jgi:beta-barrel assembly-enhancing protease